MQKNITQFIPAIKKAVSVFILIMLSYLSFSQNIPAPPSHSDGDSTKDIFHLKGGVTVTNNGISLIPTFSLGKPAAIFDLSLGKKKLFFEPQLRFALEGKPWSFIFWWRYKLLATKKFSLGLGAHPSLVFKTVTAFVNGVSQKLITADRYLATELSPNYFISKNVSVGIYYLYSHGVDRQAVRNTHFLTINSNFSHIKLTKQFYARFNPQGYYLSQDGKEGYYFTYTLTLAMKNFPLSIQTIGNKVIHTNITASKNFVWNASLIYSFNKNYVKH